MAEELNYTKHTEEVEDYLGTEDEIQEAVAAEYAINGFKGGFLVAESYLTTEVPEDFANSSTPQTTEEEYEEEVITYNEETGEEIISTVTKTKTVTVYEDDEETLVYRQKNVGRICTYLHKYHRRDGVDKSYAI